MATPPWVDKEHLDRIKKFYFACPEGHEVDHIWPLMGKASCGLHVIWNLQYLSVSENRAKGNKPPIGGI